MMTISALARSPRPWLQPVARLLMLLSITQAAHAQWSLTSLHPSGATTSSLYAGSGSQQTGYITTSTGYAHAAHWAGTSSSMVDLDPAGTYLSYANATNGSQQGGQVIAVAFSGHAYLWSGTAGSAVDLHPAGYTSSAVLALTGSMQGGYVNTSIGSSSERAAIWSGTAGSFVNLHPASHPAGFSASRITAMAGAQQAGYALTSGGSRRAILWNGSSENVIYLHAGAATTLSASAVYAMTDSLQGGVVASSSSSGERATVWAGTYSSRVELHPAGATTSRVLAMTGNFQAGQVNDQAAVWQGSAASWVNLHTEIVTQLGPNYTKSAVNGAYEQGGFVYLVGYAQDTINSKTIAVMWSNSPAVVVPSIVTPPESKAANAGATTTLSVATVGTAPLTYQWRKGGTALGAPSSPTLTLSNLTGTDAGNYDVVVSNSAGSVTSSAATLTVNPTPIGGTRNVLSPGESINLTIALTGTGTVTYQWLHNFNVIPGATTTTLALTNVTYADTGHYELKITDDTGTRSSAPVFVTVAPETTQIIAWGNNGYGQATVPTGLNDAIAIASGSLHSLALRRDGTVVAWGRNNAGQASVPSGLSDVVAISAGDNFSMALKSDGTVVQWGMHMFSLVPVPSGLNAVVTISAGYTRALALRADGTAITWGNSNASGMNSSLALGGYQSVVASDSYNAGLKLDGTVVVIDTNLSNAINQVPPGLSGVTAVAAGYNDVLALKSDGTVVGWGYNNQGVSTIPTALQNVRAIDASSSSGIALKTDGTLAVWGGTSYLNNIPTGAVDVFSVDIGNRGDTILALREVTTPLPPIITTQPQPKNVSVTGNTSFSVVADGSAPLTYQWQRYPSGGSAWANLNDGGAYTGTATASLSVTGVTVEMSNDLFRCVVTNVADTANSNAVALTVFVPLPAITTPPASQTVLLGAPIALSVVATSPVSLSYQWRKDNSDILGETAATYTIPSAQLSDAATYKVVVSNSAGSVTSATATVAVASGPPVISTHPVSQNIGTGAPVTFTVTASSTVPLSYLWKKNGNPIDGATQASYTIAATQFGNAGDYTVEVSNIAGSITSNAATLTVTLAAPIITQQPVDRTSAPTIAARFSVAAIGNPAPTYQWQISQVIFPFWVNTGESPSGYSGTQTDTLVISGNTLGNTGDRYRCIVSNSHGSTTSEPATLTVVVGGGFTKGSAGRYHSLRLDTWGRLFATGVNSAGQLGNGTTTSSSTAQQITIADRSIADIAAGAEHSLFLTTNKEVWATGLNSSGQLSDGTLVAKSTPILLTTDAIAIAAANFHSVILKSDGTLWTVGGNDSGQLGNGTTTDTTSLSQIDTHVVAIAAGIRQTLYLKSDGTLWAMGNLDGSEAFISTPDQIATNVKTMAAGGYHSLFVKNDGTLWAMGYNPYGQLGNGTTTGTTTPVQISTGVKSVAAGYFHSAFIKTDNTLWMTGYNSFGQLGDGTTTSRSSPYQLTTNVSSVSASESYTLYTKLDGSLWAVGLNGNGQFGNGNNTTTTAPVQIAAGVILPPIAPTGITATTASPYDRVSLTWTPDGNATSYEVWRNSTNDSATATRLAADLRWAIHEDLTTSLNQTYYYWVKSVNPTGASGFSAMASASTSSVVGQSITFTGPATQAYSLTPITLSATATSGLPVTFELVSGPATLSGNDLTLTGPGVVTVRASQTGNASYTAASDVERSFTVAEATATVALDNLSATYDGYPHAATATTDPEGLTVTFTYDGSGTPPTNAGSYAVIGTIDDDNYDGSASDTLVIAQAAQTITFATLADRGYTTDPITLSASATSDLTVGFTVQSGPATLNGNDLTLTGAGTVTVRATQPGNANYFAADNVDRSFTVTANVQSWLTDHFDAGELTDANISGLSADPDGDGFSNLLEYALGLDPKSADTTELPEVSTTATDWVYTFTRPTDRADLTYEVEVSTDLTSWTITLTPTYVSSSDDTETWQATYPLSSATNAFFRLKIID